MWKKLIYLDLLIAFLALTGWALAQHGWSVLSAFEVGLSTPIGLQMMADIVILAIVAMIWMYRDARLHGRNPWPWIALTLFTGSPGPVAYLLFREFDREPATAAPHSDMATAGA